MQDLEKMAHHFFGDMVKGVVDVEQRILAVDSVEIQNQIKAIINQIVEK